MKLPKAKTKAGIEVCAFVQHGDLEIVRVHNTRYVSNRVTHTAIQRPGLALAGYFKYLGKGRVQVFGKTEVGYLMQLPRENFRKQLKAFMGMRVPVIIVAENQPLDEEIISIASKNRVPILMSNLRTSLLIPRLTQLLYRHFSERIKLNGVMMDIMGMGILIMGPSGIGKSETALELVSRGSHLISDDLVEFYLNANDEVVGRSIENIKKWIEVRGVGIINIMDMFGVGALLEEKQLDLVIELEKWNPKKEYDRLGEENLYHNVLGKDIPKFSLPVAVGRNLSTLIEVAVKYFISRKRGSRSFIEHIYGEKKSPVSWDSNDKGAGNPCGSEAGAESAGNITGGDR